MEEKMKAFVVLMLNELENAIELLRLWKSLWGHRKLAPVWELACWQKRGFVWGNFLHRLAAAETLTAVTQLRLFCRHSLARPFFKKPVSFCCNPFSFISRHPGRSPPSAGLYSYLLVTLGLERKGSWYTILIFCVVQRVTLHPDFAGLAHAFCY